MFNNKSDEDLTVQGMKPIEIIPFGEAFREDLYHLYQVYRPEDDLREG
jgi:hypothetical protein